MFRMVKFKRFPQSHLSYSHDSFRPGFLMVAKFISLSCVGKNFPGISALVKNTYFPRQYLGVMWDYCLTLLDIFIPTQTSTSRVEPV